MQWPNNWITLTFCVAPWLDRFAPPDAPKKEWLMAMEMFISEKVAREWMNLFLFYTKKEKFVRLLKKICKRFVSYLKRKHLINIWNVLCGGGKFFKTYWLHLDCDTFALILDYELWSWTLILILDADPWSWSLILILDPDLWSWSLILITDPDHWCLILDPDHLSWSLILDLDSAPYPCHYPDLNPFLIVDSFLISL